MRSERYLAKEHDESTMVYLLNETAPPTHDLNGIALVSDATTTTSPGAVQPTRTTTKFPSSNLDVLSPPPALQSYVTSARVGSDTPARMVLETPPKFEMSRYGVLSYETNESPFTSDAFKSPYMSDPTMPNPSYATNGPTQHHRTHTPVYTASPLPRAPLLPPHNDRGRSEEKPTLYRSESECTSSTSQDDISRPTTRSASMADDWREFTSFTPPSTKRHVYPKKCDFPMCKNSSRSRGFCYSHGGGRRCRIEGCSNGAVSRDLCKRHGGGRRCRMDGCKSSAESGGLCYSHGGGRRCKLSGCSARAKKGGLCSSHLSDSDNLKVRKTEQSSAVETLLSLGQESRVQNVKSNPYALSSILN